MTYHTEDKLRIGYGERRTLEARTICPRIWNRTIQPAQELN